MTIEDSHSRPFEHMNEFFQADFKPKSGHQILIFAHPVANYNALLDSPST